ncbi:excalibur calcium-binding domain-containing protein [Streptococcus sp. 10F2]
MKTILTLIFLISAVGIWYFSKREPNKLFRRVTIGTTIWSALLIGYTNPKPETTTSQATISSSSTTSTSSTKTSTNKEKQPTEAEKLVNHLEQEQTHENLQAAQQAVDKLDNTTTKSTLQKRIDTVANQIQKKEISEKQKAEEAQKKAKEKQQAEQAAKEAAEKEAQLAAQQEAERQAQLAAQQEAERQAQLAAQQEAERQAQLAAQQEAERQAQLAAQQETASSYYPNCSAARAAGAAPVYSGQPGYGRHLDRDGDGIGCE